MYMYACKYIYTCKCVYIYVYTQARSLGRAWARGAVHMRTPELGDYFRQLCRHPGVSVAQRRVAIRVRGCDRGAMLQQEPHHLNTMCKGGSAVSRELNSQLRGNDVTICRRKGARDGDFEFFYSSRALS